MHALWMICYISCHTIPPGVEYMFVYNQTVLRDGLSYFKSILTKSPLIADY